MDVERWVDERIGFLDSGASATPDSARVFARLTARERRRRSFHRGLLRAGVAASLACVSLAAVGTIRRLHPNLKPVTQIAQPPAPALTNPEPVVVQIAPAQVRPHAPDDLLRGDDVLRVLDDRPAEPREVV